MICRSWRC